MRMRIILGYQHAALKLYQPKFLLFPNKVEFITQVELIDRESSKGKEKGQSPAARRVTQKGTKDAAKKPKSKSVSTSSEENECVTRGDSSMKCKHREMWVKCQL